MPLNSYLIDVPINVLRGQCHVVLAKGRYETSDAEIIRTIHSYPGVRFLGSKSAPAVAFAGGEAPGAPVPPETVVTGFGLQMRQRRPHGGRVAD